MIAWRFSCAPRNSHIDPEIATNPCIYMYHKIAVVAPWIRPQTLNREVPGLNLLAAAVVPLDKALYPHCLVPWKRLKAVGPHGCLLTYKQLAFLVTK